MTPPNMKMYCPYPTCSEFILLQVLEDPGRFACPTCNKQLCSLCKSKWHENYTCEEFQKLPPEFRDPDALPLIKYASDNNFRICEKCNHVIELKTGCNHMTCRCGYQFCYKCGRVWTANHGCEFWDENRLVEAAQERTLHIPIVRREAARVQLENTLRNFHCTHENFERVEGRGGTCHNCPFYMWAYFFRCDTCQISVCFTCRFHRLRNF